MVCPARVPGRPWSPKNETSQTQRVTGRSPEQPSPKCCSRGNLRPPKVLENGTNVPEFPHFRAIRRLRGCRFLNCGAGEARARVAVASPGLGRDAELSPGLRPGLMTVAASRLARVNREAS